MKPLPTGPNPLPGLHEFTVRQTVVKIDGQEGDFFSTNYFGHFWLVGALVVASTHLIPSDVRHALQERGITAPAGIPIRRA